MFKVGVPSKSGVSGLILIVIPNVCGIAVWSPPIDIIGNSVRGCETAVRIVEEFGFHGISFDNHNKLNCFDYDHEVDVLKSIVGLDVHNLIKLFNSGVNLFTHDYDLRNSLHLAVET